MSLSYKKISSLSLLFSLCLICSCSNGQKNPETAARNDHQTAQERISFIRNDGEKKVDVMIDGEHFTSYLYPETIAKPVLYPIRTSRGTLVTRGFPLESRAGERVDHPHHIGLWLNYGDVNGLDFWNNSDAIPAEKKAGYGTIVHQDVHLTENGEDSGNLEVSMNWVDSKGSVLLKEETTFVFQGTESERTIDRITTLAAQEIPVSFTDNKEGMLGLRMARELEHPSDKEEMFTDANGIPTKVLSLNNEGVTGMYRGSNGLTGDDVWGTRGEWMNLSGEIKGEKISVAILDHPENVGFPTYWHSRGYGLYAANPLGQKAMSDGKDELNFRLDAGESVTFKYRIIVYSGEEITDEQINSDYKEFTAN